MVFNNPYRIREPIEFCPNTLLIMSYVTLIIFEMRLFEHIYYHIFPDLNNA